MQIETNKANNKHIKLKQRKATTTNTSTYSQRKANKAKESN